VKRRRIPNLKQLRDEQSVKNILYAERLERELTENRSKIDRANDYAEDRVG